MFKKKTYTLYAVQHKDKNGNFALIGLYKDENEAKKFCKLLNDFTLRNFGVYEVHTITTDLN